jgi:hypothetical protein
MAMFKSSGSVLLGGGFMSGFSESLAPGLSVDNGFIDLVIQFGYLGSLVIFSIFGWIIVSSARQIIIAPPSAAKIVIFPLNSMLVLLLINVSETNFMLKHISTVLIAVSVCQIIRWNEYLRPLRAGGTERDRLVRPPSSASRA